MIGQFDAKEFKVIIFGKRKGLLRSLVRNEIDYALVLEKEPEKKPKVPYVVVKEFTRDVTLLEKQLEPLLELGQWTHVIASVEASVYTASLARRIVNARLSKDTIILKCYDKLKMKEFLSKFNIPMTKFMDSKHAGNPDVVMDYLGKPVISKERISSGGRGLQIIDDTNELRNQKHEKRILEKYIKGEELSVESFINHRQILFKNVTRYYSKKKTNIVPSGHLQELEKIVLDINQNIIRAIGIKWGMTHAEFYITENGEALFGEIALRPPGGYIMELIERSYGFNAWDAFLAMELDLPFTFPCTPPRKFSAATLFHPGKGKIKNIIGEEWLESRESVKDYKVRAKIGDEVFDRMGVSENSAWVIQEEKSLEKITKEIEALNSNFNIVIER